MSIWGKRTQRAADATRMSVVIIEAVLVGMPDITVDELLATLRRSADEMDTMAARDQQQ